MLRKLYFLSNWMGYYRREFPFDFELNGIQSGSKLEG